mgnify:CR=1 FL=1
MLALLALLLAPPTDPAAAPPVRELAAARAGTPPAIDGDLSDRVWREAVPSGGFTQRFPHAGQPFSLSTTVRAAYDEEALYFAIECDDPEPGRILAPVTRRDRQMESDCVSVYIDSRNDRRTAFFFWVNAAGVQADGTVADDNVESLNWDGVWEAKTRVTQRGWQAELRIPLRLLRYQTGTDAAFGLNVVRNASRIGQVGSWQHVPIGQGAWVSRFGRLTGLHLPAHPVWLSLAPFVAARPAIDDAGRASIAPLDLGVDIAAALGRDINLTAAINPDFGQVEADQVVLNLSTVETYFPEKRPFFLEDKSLFELPSFGDMTPVTLLYTRRIGRASRDPDLEDGEELLRAPPPARILGAGKIAGTTPGRLAFGALTALTGPTEGRVRRADGGETDRQAEPLASYNALRLRQEFWENSSAGLLCTGMFARGQGGALAAAADTQLEFGGGRYQVIGKLFGSYLSADRFRLQDRYTRAFLERDGGAGYGAELLLRKKGGSSLVGAVGGQLRSANLAVNDMGYLDRPDLLFGFGWLQWRRLEPIGPLASMSVNFNAWSQANTGLDHVGSGLNVNGNLTFQNQWFVWAYASTHPPYCSDREARAPGRVLACFPNWVFEGGFYVGSDRRAALAGDLGLYAGSTQRGLFASAEGALYLNPHPRLQVELVPSYSRVTGSLRWIDTWDTGGVERFLFAEQHSEYLNLILRATYSLRPELSLQGYSQLFLAAVDHGKKFAPAEPAGGRIDIGALLPDPTIPDDYDESQLALSLGLVLRWEYRPGSIAYLVYTGSFGQSSAAADFRFGRTLRDVWALDGTQALLLKLSWYV